MKNFRDWLNESPDRNPSDYKFVAEYGSPPIRFTINVIKDPTTKATRWAFYSELFVGKKPPVQIFAKDLNDLHSQLENRNVDGEVELLKGEDILKGEKVWKTGVLSVA